MVAKAFFFGPPPDLLDHQFGDKSYLMLLLA